jgi:hypothetical protein
VRRQLTTGTWHLNDLLDKNWFFYFPDLLHKYRLLDLFDHLDLLLDEYWHLFYYLLELNHGLFVCGLFADKFADLATDLRQKLLQICYCLVLYIVLFGKRLHSALKLVNIAFHIHDHLLQSVYLFL